MSRNPYDPRAGRDLDSPGEFLVESPSRTSVLAIVALVCSILCVLGPIGAVLGGISLILIGTSRGRLRGTGIAATAVVLGLISCLLLTVVVYGARRISDSYRANAVEPTVSTIEAIQNGDFANARSLFSAQAVPEVTEAELKAFQSAINEKLGAYRNSPDSLLAILNFDSNVQGSDELKAYMEKRRNKTLPVYAAFEHGSALILLHTNMEQDDFAMVIWGGATVESHVVNMIVIPSSGDLIWLVKPEVANLPAPSGPTPPGAADQPPALPEPPETPESPQTAPPTPPEAPKPG